MITFSNLLYNFLGVAEYDQKNKRRKDRLALREERLKKIEAAEKKSNVHVPRMKKNPTRVVEPRDWTDDPSEKSRRIWERWRLYRDLSTFQYFKVAVRIVVLVQVSSASVERVFSQLVQITNACGDGLLRDMLQLRLMRLINHVQYNKK